MQPTTPVMPGQQFTETIIAEHQDEYQNLPAIVLESGQIITRWRFSWRERLRVLFSGDILFMGLEFQTTVTACVA